MIVISDTTPIISLLKAEQLEVLEALFGEVFIPEAVYEELTGNQKFQLEAEKVKKCPFIKVKQVEDIKSVNIFQRVTGLDAGESESIVMAEEKQADLLLIDEKKARHVAKQMGLAITGQKQTLSPLVRLFLSSFLHRADARCFLSGVAGQEDAPVSSNNLLDMAHLQMWMCFFFLEEREDVTQYNITTKNHS